MESLITVVVTLLFIAVILLPVIAIVMVLGTKRKVQNLEKDMLALGAAYEGLKRNVPQAKSDDSTQGAEENTEESVPEKREAKVPEAQSYGPERTAPVVSDIVSEEPHVAVELDALPGSMDAPRTEPIAVYTQPIDTPLVVEELYGVTEEQKEEKPLPELAATPQQKKPRSKEEWEALVGGKLLNRIGALALIIGIGFFLKYAFDNNWITETMRVGIGAAIGLAAIWIGIRTEKKGYEVFAQGLLGAGIAILYITAYAAFNFYSLIPQVVAFGLMAIVTAGTFALAIRYNSFAIALLGWAGGTITPFMLSTGTANEVGLFGYIAVFTIGLLAIAYRKPKWAALEILALLGMYLIYGAWQGEYYTPQDFWVTAGFLALFWLMFTALAILRAYKKQEDIHPFSYVTSMANTFVGYLFGIGLLNQSPYNSAADFSLAMALFYFLVLFLLERRNQVNSVTQQHFLFTAIVLIPIGTAIEFREYTLVMLLFAEAFAITWYGVRRGMPSVITVAGALHFLTLLVFFSTTRVFFPADPDAYTLLFTVRSAAFVVSIASLIASAFTLQKSSNTNMASIGIMYRYGWCLLLVVWLSVETQGLFDVMAVRLPGSMLWGNHLAVFFGLATVWLALGLLMVAYGLRNRKSPQYHCGVILLLAATAVGMVAGYDVFRVDEPFTLLTNVRAIGMALLIIAGVLFYYVARSNKERYAWLEKAGNAALIVVVVALFQLMSVEVRDHFYSTIPPALQEGGNRTTNGTLSMLNRMHLTLSGVWLAYSALLMAFGIWRRKREVRVIAFILFGITILKVFFFDLSFLNSLYRIFSFIGMGIVLLTISFLFQRYKDLIFGASAPEMSNAEE